jgi:small subunit ribosomal protein S15
MAKKTRGARSRQKVLRTESPKWVQMSKKDIEELVIKLHSDGVSSAMIGARLRDQYGVPSVKLVTGKSITQILKDNKVKIEIPEDLSALLKRVSVLQSHLRENPKDSHNRRGLQLMEARIRKLVKYYQKKGTLPMSWKYTSDTVKLQIK